MTDPNPNTSAQVDMPLPDITLSPWLYWTLVTFTLVMYVIALTAGMIFWQTRLWEVGPLTFDAGPGLIVLVLVHAALSLIGKSVAIDGFGVLDFYGRALKKAGGGPHFVPWLLVSQIFRGDEGDPLPQGKTAYALRIPTRDPDEGEDRPLDTQMTLDVEWYATGVVQDPLQFLIRARNLERGKELIMDMGDSALSEEFSTRTPAGVIRNTVQINEGLDDRIRRKAIGLGVLITQAHIKRINYGHTLSKDMSDRAGAPFRAQSVEIDAKAQRTKLEELGAGAASAAAALEFKTLEARGNGQAHIIDKLKVSGSEVLATEFGREALKNADTVVLGAQNGLQDLLGAVVGTKSVLDRMPGKDTTPKQEEQTP